MGANVLRGQFSQDVGRLFVMLVLLLYFPIAQNSQLPFLPAVALKKHDTLVKLHPPHDSPLEGNFITNSIVKGIRKRQEETLKRPDAHNGI